MKSSKLLIFLFFTLFLSGLNLQAQNYFGFRAGTNLAYVSTTEEGFITNERVLGLNVHLFLDLGLGKNFAVQPELGFIQKGYRRTITLTGVKRYAIKINYLDLAASLKYKFGNKNFKAHLIAGPYFGLALSAQSKDLDDGDTNKIGIEEGGGIRRPDVGLTVGVGVGIPAGEGDLFLDIRYLHGFNKINVNSFDDGDLSNRGQNISIGYALPIGR